MKKEYLCELLDDEHIKSTVKNILTDSLDDRKIIRYLYSGFKSKKYNLKEYFLKNIDVIFTNMGVRIMYRLLVFLNFFRIAFLEFNGLLRLSIGIGESVLIWGAIVGVVSVKDYIKDIIIRKKCLSKLAKKLKKIENRDRERVKELDTARKNIKDVNIKMIYECLIATGEIKYDGWAKDAEELKEIYDEYTEIMLQRELSTEPMLSVKEQELIGRIGNISKKIEIIKLELAIKNDNFLKKVYAKKTEIENNRYNGSEEHIKLLDDLAKEYISYKRVEPLNDKADFDEEEKKKEASFEMKFSEICHIISVYREKDKNDMIIDSVFDYVSRDITTLDDSVVKLDLDDKGPRLKKKL